MMRVIVKPGMSETSPRQRMIRSAALLIRERGVEATSFADVLAHSGAPRGSIYHHFPGGKAQLVEEATRWVGASIAEAERAALAGDDPLAGLDAAIAVWRAMLERTDFAAGCPLAAATVEGDSVPTARDAAGAAFRSWVDPFAHTLQRRGLPRDRARSLATLVVASIEGALILARAQRSMSPMDRVGAELRRTLAAALEG
jgi:TetR/AcrR family transcriptional regulator, lmrAB and yxaGH operons repressor